MIKLSLETTKRKTTNWRTQGEPIASSARFDGNCFVVTTVSAATSYLANIKNAFIRGFDTNVGDPEKRLIAFVSESDAVHYGRATAATDDCFAVIHLKAHKFHRWDLITEIKRDMCGRNCDMVVLEKEGKGWMESAVTTANLGDIHMRVYRTAL